MRADLMGRKGGFTLYKATSALRRIDDALPRCVFLLLFSSLSFLPLSFSLVSRLINQCWRKITLHF